MMTYKDHSGLGPSQATWGCLRWALVTLATVVVRTIRRGRSGRRTKWFAFPLRW